MSTGDFAAELEQSVQTHVDEIRLMAAQAKARIGESVAAHAPAPAPQTFEEEPAVRRGAAVAFDDVPDFSGGAVNFDAPDDPIFLDPPSEAGANVDDDGIPVWEDIP